MLLNHGAVGQGALSVSILSNSSKEVFDLLLEHPTAMNIDYSSEDSCFTPLAFSLINGDTYKVSELLKHGSDQNSKINLCEGFSIFLTLQDPDQEKGYIN